MLWSRKNPGQSQEMKSFDSHLVRPQGLAILYGIHRRKRKIQHKKRKQQRKVRTHQGDSAGRGQWHPDCRQPHQPKTTILHQTRLQPSRDPNSSKAPPVPWRSIFFFLPSTLIWLLSKLLGLVSGCRHKRLNSKFRIFTPQKLAPNCTKTDRKSFTPSTEFERVCSRHATTTKRKEREGGVFVRQQISGGYI